ncbi:hypothetical protein AJ80_03089 [Polytolypa hystricis UAMH7299]|uniref:Signal recognition particle subunit SRP72 n=1 Tax=Polytolypa hystricis (strain UAMH7299) TaxID=1447883 RepID=A0A2B7YJA9_POLH7|nr:hypothetical protein AJ80_03089 [Polytolypa hystricis UAMH7299]
MAATSVQSLSVLLQRSTVDDHEEIVKACNAALKKSKRDIEVQHVKTVALLKLDRFEDAIRVIEEGGDALKQRAPLEWAYALYKVGKLDEAIELAASSAVGRGAKHVEAQAAYRAEAFHRSAEIYAALLAEEAELSQERNDLRINSRAALAQLHWTGQSSGVSEERPSREDLEAFETTYDLACGAIARGELDQGALLLRRAKELCKSSEDLAPEDKVAEILPIAVQQLYVALRLGKTEEAEQLAEGINVEEITELSTKRIAQSNLLLLPNAPSNPYLLHKQFHQTPKSTDSDKLFSFQNRTISANSHAIDLLVRKFDGVARSTEKVLSKQSAPTTSPDVNTLSVLNVAAHAQDVTPKTTLKKALPLLERRPQDVGLVLTIVQLHVTAGNVSSAISVLEAFFKLLDECISEADQDVRFNPGLVSILISLYQQQGRRHHVKTELAKAASHWQQRPHQSPSLLRAAGASLLHSSDTSDIKIASEIFAKLRETDPADYFATAGYVASHATTDPERVKSEADQLTPVQELTSGIDVVALENAGIPSTSTMAPTAPGLRRKRGADDKEPPARKRVRKSRLPKNYDPDKKPDPERWLPLRDRSSYRPPKGKKGKQRAADRTQGGIVSEKSEESSTTTAAPVSQPKQGGGSSKRKKGKGKR